MHSFAQSEIGPFFLTFLILLTTVSTGLMAWRWKDLKSEQRLDSPMSREAAFIFNNWMFLVMTGVVLFGTLWPKIKEGLTGQDIAMGPAWFNRWMIPLGLILLLIMGVGTIIAWRRASKKNFQRNFIMPIVSMAIFTPLSIGLYWVLRGADLGVHPDPLEAGYAISAVALCIFAAATTLQEFARGMMARRRMHDETHFESLVNLCMKQKRRYGGYIVHLGIVFAYLAFAGNAMKIEKDVSLRIGESVTIGDYTLTYQGLREQNDREKLLVIADVPVTRGGKYLYDLEPGKAIFHSSPEMPISEIDIRSTPVEDVYVALVNYDSSGQVAAFKVFIGPFTWWFWFGGVLLVLGTLICLWPTREGMEKLRFRPMPLVRAAIFGSLVALCFSPLVIWTVESHSPWGSAHRWVHIPMTADLELELETVFEEVEDPS
ncbi:MAG: cytochrome c-type biogenesis CcmF C-terminal domain-containing protein [Bradymonadaceae bacterium]